MPRPLIFAAVLAGGLSGFPAAADPCVDLHEHARLSALVMEALVAIKRTCVDEPLDDVQCVVLSEELPTSVLEDIVRNGEAMMVSAPALCPD